jgi:hypothetical protein
MLSPSGSPSFRSTGVTRGGIHGVLCPSTVDAGVRLYYGASVLRVFVDRDVSIDGDQAGLSELALLLDAGTGSIHSTDPSPFGRGAQGIRVVTRESPVRVSATEDGWVEFAGSVECLQKTASFARIASDTPQAHSHYEYYSGNEWIHPDSLPVVFSHVS